MKKIITILFLAIFVGIHSLPVYAKEASFSDFHSEEVKLYAKSAVLLDAQNGRILYGKAADTPMANASTTKIMTCILAIENASLEDEVTVSAYACTMPKVRMGFSEGDTFYLRDLLLSLMLESHNDTAVAIAEYISGSVEAFADLMNAKAKEIGCQNTHFVTPNGLDREDTSGPHQTTASDLARIMAYCIQNDQFLEITQTPNATISTVDGSKSFSLVNHNALLQTMDGAISGKTGFTSKAGYCYVGACEKEGYVYTFALLACGWPNHRNYKWADSAALMDFAVEKYSMQTVEEGVRQRKIPLLHGVRHHEDQDTPLEFPETITAKTTDDTVTALLSEDDQITVFYEIPESVEAPVKEGTPAGMEVISLNGVPFAWRQMYFAESAQEYTLRWCLQYLLKAYDL